MIGLDAKGYCALDQAVQGVGWWWGEVGGVVAGSDGAVVSDGMSFTALALTVEAGADNRLGYDSVPKAILATGHAAL